MGSSRHRFRVCDFAVRCCHGAFCAIGFLSTVFFLMALFWIVWCYFGLSMVQVSTGQRRALVNYSLTKPTQTTISVQTSSDESSSNTISESSPTSPSIHKARGESKSIPDNKPRGNASLMAKGDFADRDRALPMAKDLSIVSTVPPSLIPDLNNNKTKDISNVEIKDDGIHTRRVATSNDNQHESAILNTGGRDNDNPSKTPYDPILKSDSVPNEDVSRDKMRTSSREYPKEEGDSTAVRDEIQSSKRSDVDTASRVPNFDRDPSRTYMRERTRYDEDEYGGTRRRTDPRDRVPYIEDRYAKGDTRSYPDDDIGRRSDQRRREERYGDYSSDDVPRRRGDDDDRIRDADDRYRYRDGDSRYRSRDTRYDDRDEEYRSRDDDRYRLRDDDRRYRLRGDTDDRSGEDDKYRTRYDDRDRPRIDDRDIPPRIGDRHRPLRVEDRDIPKIDDRDRPKVDDRDIPIRTDDKDRPRIDGSDKPITDDKDGVIIDDRDRSRTDDRDRRIIDDRGRTRNDDRVDRFRKIDDIYKTREDSVNRRKVDDKSYTGYEDREKVRAEERYRLQDDDKDKGYRNRDSYRDVIEDEDDYRSRVDSRRRTSEDKFTDVETRYSDRDRYRPRVEDDPYDDDTRSIRRNYKDPVTTRTDTLPPLPIRKSSSDGGNKEVSDYPIRRTDDIPSSVLSETRRMNRDDEYRRPSRYDDRDRISPTRVRDDTYSTSLGSRSRSDMNYPALTGSRSRDRYPEDTTRIRDVKKNDEEYRRRLHSSSGGSSEYSPSDDTREYKTRLPVERVGTRYVDRGDEVVLDRRSYSSEEEGDYSKHSNSRTTSDSRRDSNLRGDDYPYEHLSRTDDRKEYPLRRKDDDGEEYRRERPRSDYDAPRTKLRDSYDDYSRDDDRYDDERPVRRYDDTPRRRDDAGMNKDDRPNRNTDDRPADRVYPSPKIDEARVEAPRPSRRDPIMSSSSSPRAPIDTRLQDRRDRSPSDSRDESQRISPDSDRGEPSRPVERPLNAKDVIEAALRHSDMGDALRKVSYPVFDPRVSNLTSPDVIRASERRGTTILSRRRRWLGV